MATTRQASAAPGGVELRRVQPEGRPLDVAFAGEPPTLFSYDAKGRVMHGRRGHYTYGAHGRVTLTHDGRASQLRVDEQGRIVEENGVRYKYDADGRLVRVDSGGRFITYTYAADGTYRVSHNYPDREEYCEADLVQVERDARGRVSSDQFEGCGINETPHTLRYHYDDRDRIDRIEVDLNSDGSIDGVVHLRYC